MAKGSYFRCIENVILRSKWWVQVTKQLNTSFGQVADHNCEGHERKKNGTN